MVNIDQLQGHRKFIKGAFIDESKDGGSNFLMILSNESDKGFEVV